MNIDENSNDSHLFLNNSQIGVVPEYFVSNNMRIQSEGSYPPSPTSSFHSYSPTYSPGFLTEPPVDPIFSNDFPEPLPPPPPCFMQHQLQQQFFEHHQQMLQQQISAQYQQQMHNVSSSSCAEVNYSMMSPSLT
eukprot:Pgem_evm1s15548